jgi:hypothetical protein
MINVYMYYARHVIAYAKVVHLFKFDWLLSQGMV